MPPPRRVSASKPLTELPLVPAKVHMPRPVEMRLELLVEGLMKRARDLGQVTRGDVVGTLLLTREADDELVTDLGRYRDAVVGDALPGRRQITLPPRRRGRPPRQRG